MKLRVQQMMNEIVNLKAKTGIDHEAKMSHKGRDSRNARRNKRHLKRRNAR